jgi:hypothetical protein
VRGFAVGVLSLIALQVFSSSGGPEAGGKLVGWINTGLKKALSGEVALIPTAKTAPAAAPAPSTPAGGISLPRNPPLSVQV